MIALVRAVTVWIVLLITAVANGAVREFAFVPRMGEATVHASRAERGMRGRSASSGCP